MEALFARNLYARNLHARNLYARNLRVGRMSRHWSGAVTVLVAVALTAVGLPAPAQAATVWGGTFSYAFAENASPVLDKSTLVRFGVSEPLNAAVIHMNDEKGAFLAECSQGSECSWLANPGPGETKTYTALLRVQRDGHWVDVATRSVSVTDPGWPGNFASASADNASPVLDQSTYVRFGVSEPLNAAYIHVNDELGAIVADCSQGLECDIPSNPSPGQTKTYTARLRVYLNGQWVERSGRVFRSPIRVGRARSRRTRPIPVLYRRTLKRGSTSRRLHRRTTAIKVYVDGVLKAHATGQEMRRAAPTLRSVRNRYMWCEPT